MKNTLIVVLLIVGAFVSNVKADITSTVSNVSATVTSAVQQAQTQYDQAKAALANAQKFANGIIPANTNAPATNATVSTPAATVTGTNAPSAIKETINDAVIGILHGVKDGGGEIYQASKSAITHAVDFTMEQAPLVVTEFLHWKLAEAVIYTIAWSIPAVILICIARAFNKQSKLETVPAEDKYKTDKKDYGIMKWVARSVALIWLTSIVSTYGLTITKIVVAPRVYLIEYVVATVHTGVPPSQ